MLLVVWCFLPFFLQVIQETDVFPWTKLLEQSPVIIILGTIIYYQKLRIESLEKERKTLYDMQSKEYLASLNIMAASADSNTKLKIVLEDQPETLKRVAVSQKKMELMMEDILNNLDRQ